MSVPNRRAAMAARPYPMAGTLAVGYALFGVAWILFSDHLLLALAPDMRVLTALGQGKGLAFVLATSAVLFWLARRREQHIEDTHRQWAMAFENTRDGVMIADAHGRIQTINRAFTEITGYTEADALGKTTRLLQSGMHDAGFYRDLWLALRDHGHWQGEIWNRRKDGALYPEWLTVSAVRDTAGLLTHYVGVFTDITRAKHSEAQLDHLAHYDPLTGLPNRSLLHTRLEQTLARAARHRSKVAAL